MNSRSQYTLSFQSNASKFGVYRTLPTISGMNKTFSTIQACYFQQNYYSETTFDYNFVRLAKVIFSNEFFNFFKGLLLNAFSMHVSWKTTGVVAQVKRVVSVMLPTTTSTLLATSIININRFKKTLKKLFMEKIAITQFDPYSPDIPQNITRRERECLEWVTKGKSAEEVGYILNISKKTVERHIENMKRKLDCVKLPQLVYTATKMNLID